MAEYGGFLITYRRPEIVRGSLEAVLSQTVPPKALLVVDNGNCGRTMAVAEGLHSDGVSYQALPDNLGPAGAAAIGFSWLRDRGFEWGLWLDDDDPPRFPDTVERLLMLLDAHRGDSLAGVAAVGARWDWDTGETRRIPDEDLRGTVEVDAIGGNQILFLRRSAVEGVGGPSTELFFGLEEMELCLRLRRAGHKLLVDGDLMRQYRESTGRIGFERRRALVPRHEIGSLWRRYYTTRNYIYLMRRSFQRPDLARRELVKALIRTCTSTLRGPAYAGRYGSYQLRGIVDGYRGRMGRTVEPTVKAT